MKVILEVGPRNEELIEKVREAKLNGEDVWEIGKPSSEMYDALYYACECGDIMLEDQARFLQWLLLHEETEYYTERMLIDTNHDSSMNNSSATADVLMTSSLLSIRYSHTFRRFIQLMLFSSLL